MGIESFVLYNSTYVRTLIKGVFLYILVVINFTSCKTQKPTESAPNTICTVSEFVWANLSGQLETLRMPYNEEADPMNLGWYLPVPKATFPDVSYQLVSENDQFGWSLMASFESDNPDSVVMAWITPLTDCLKTSVEKKEMEDELVYWFFRQGNKIMQIETEWASSTITIFFYLKNP